MTRNRWIVLAVLFAGIVAVQAAGLERFPEWEEEKSYHRLGGLPATDVLPTYVASLLFGSFRAVAIDALWIQLKKVEEEKRWYERREILRLIARFQPRNPEVWAHLGWHSAYNVANSFSDPDRAWEWVEFGLKWLHDGTRHLPQSAYLKDQIAFTLYHKPSWRDGKLDFPLLRRVESDLKLQEVLQETSPIPRPMSAFELAIRWYAKARDSLVARGKTHEVTPMGLRIMTSSLDGFIRDSMYLQGIYLWKHRNQPEEAKDWFRRAYAHVADMKRKYGDEMPILDNYLLFYPRLPEIVDLDVRARSGRPEDERALMEALLALTIDSGPHSILDRDFLWSREGETVPASELRPLNRLKRKFSQNWDLLECNDAFKLASPLRAGELARANLQPDAKDADFYVLPLENPDRKAGADARPPAPVPVALRFTRPQDAQVDLRVTVFSPSRDKLSETVVRGDRDVPFAAAQYGTYYVKVEPASAPSPWPSDTRYNFRYSAGR